MDQNATAAREHAIEKMPRRVLAYDNQASVISSRRPAQGHDLHPLFRFIQLAPITSLDKRATNLKAPALKIEFTRNNARMQGYVPRMKARDGDEPQGDNKRVLQNYETAMTLLCDLCCYKHSSLAWAGHELPAMPFIEYDPHIEGEESANSEE